VLRLRPALVALCATLVLTSCGSGETATEEPGAGEDTVGESSGPAGPPVALEAAADLARRLDVAEDEVSVESVEEVTWNDGSLGCAEKGTMYTQALVDGSRIVLRVGDRTYEYHSGGSRAPFLCEKPTQ
jgi:hypothetical protein